MDRPITIEAGTTQFLKPEYCRYSRPLAIKAPRLHQHSLEVLLLLCKCQIRSCQHGIQMPRSRDVLSHMLRMCTLVHHIILLLPLHFHLQDPFLVLRLSRFLDTWTQTTSECLWSNLHNRFLCLGARWMLAIFLHHAQVCHLRHITVRKTICRP